MSDGTATFHIRFIPDSTNDDERWRLIFNGEEWWLKNIVINGLTYTTMDWMPDTNSYKWHVTCHGYCRIKDKVAYITTTPPEGERAIARHWLKTVSYQVLETLGTYLVSNSITGSHNTAISICILGLSFKPLMYFLHERVWLNFVKLKK